MITIILIVLFFIVLLFKPTYWMMDVTTDDGQEGTMAACSALFWVIFLKCKLGNDLILLSGRDYDKVVDFFNEHFHEGED